MLEDPYWQMSAGLGKGRAVLGTPGWFYFPSAS